MVSLLLWLLILTLFLHFNFSFVWLCRRFLFLFTVTFCYNNPALCENESSIQFLKISSYRASVRLYCG